MAQDERLVPWMSFENHMTNEKIVRKVFDISELKARLGRLCWLHAAQEKKLASYIL